MQYFSKRSCQGRGLERRFEGQRNHGGELVDKVAR